MLTGAQIRAARALLDWTAKDLALKSGVSYATIQRAESAADVPSMNTGNFLALIATLEAAGIVLLGPKDPPLGGYGVKLVRKSD